MAKELHRYNIDIAALSETRLPDSAQLEERGSEFTFFWSGRPASEPRQSGVGFAIRNQYLKLLDKLPQGINDRLMTMRLKVSAGFITIISAYAPTMTYPDEIKEEFYEQLGTLIQSVPHSDKLFLLGDFNARVGTDYIAWNKVIGHHGMGKENSNGTLLLTLCAEKQLVITNTLFQQKSNFKSTWKHPRSGHWHQIDFVIIRQQDWHDVKLTRAMKATTCHSDHALLRSKVSISFKPSHQHRQVQRARKLDVGKLASREAQDTLRDNITAALMDPENTNHENGTSHWDDLRTKIFQASADSVGFVKRKHKDWFDENDPLIDTMLDELHKLHAEYANDKNSQGKKDRYNKAKQLTQAKLREMKDNWWVERTNELQVAADTNNAKKFFSELKAVYGPSSRGSSPLYDLDGQTLIKEPALITDRWAQHFNLLLNRQSSVSDDAIEEVPQRPVIKELDIIPTAEETAKAIKQLSCGKAPGEDGIPPEVYKLGGDTLVAELTRLFERLWAEEEVPQDFKDALIIHLYKNKGDRRSCDNHRGISLLSIAGKIFARIIINRLTTHLDSTFPESQCGFRSGRGTADMLFAARQIQEKCREQNLDLYMVFVDLTKAFDSVSREGLWKLLSKIGCPSRVVNIIRSFHDGMMARVQDLENLSDAFPVTNGTKQGCVMAPFLFGIVFSAMLYDAFKNCNKGIMIRFRQDGGIFNLQRLKARSKVSSLLLRELLFADDCALLAYTEDDLQSMLDDFAKAAARYGLTISIKKTEVMYQPKPGSPPKDPVIKIGNDQLKVVHKFCYLGGFLSQNALIDDEITSRIGKASAAFGRLHHRLWSDHGIRLNTKIGVYRTVVLTSLLYGSESWTWYRRHVRRLDQFHLRCLRKICGISWKDRVPNTDVLERCEIEGIEALLIKNQLRWAGHLVRMEDSRIPKSLFYGELVDGHRSRGGQHKRYKDVLKSSLKACNIPTGTWERQALSRTEWRATCRDGVEVFEGHRINQLQERRLARHTSAVHQPLPSRTFVCPDCQRHCRSQIGLFSHRRVHSSLR